MSSSLTLRRIQIGKNNTPSSNITIYDLIESDGKIRIGAGTIENPGSTIVVFQDGKIQLAAPETLGVVLQDAAGKEIVNAEWTNLKIQAFTTAVNQSLASLNATVNEALNNLIPKGTIVYFPLATAPNGFLKCNGAAISRSTYSSLFNAIGGTYGAGNGSTTFNVPDLRGEFIRCLDDGRGVDNGRTIGSFQSDAIPYHKHVVPWGENQFQEFGIIGGNGYTGSGDTDRDNGRMLTNDGNLYLGVNPNPGVNFSNESRPRNIALLPCIKF